MTRQIDLYPVKINFSGTTGPAKAELGPACFSSSEVISVALKKKRDEIDI